jgi:hypothetical protein
MKSDSLISDVFKGTIISGISTVVLLFVNYNLDYAGMGGTSIFSELFQGLIVLVFFIAGAIIGLMLSSIALLLANLFKMKSQYKSLAIILFSPVVMFSLFAYYRLHLKNVI